MAKRVIVPCSDGFEEIEMMTIIDVLRRAGVDVVLASLDGTAATGRSGVKVTADMNMDEAAAMDFDMVVLPGGLPNAYTLRDDSRVIELIKKTASKGSTVAAICAAPAALEKAGVLKGREATNYPSLKSDLESCSYQEKTVVQSGNVITSRGPATAMEFALKLAETLAGAQIAAQVAEDLLAPAQ
jgi:4-methyl-5(b-hydroxyethyl)-thiazole monophosphate biosynthesis